MTRVLAAWRRLGAALVALVLGVIVLGPGLEAIVCQGEAGLAQLQGDAEILVTAAEQDLHPGDAAGPCVHGHCHHAGALAAPDATASEPRLQADVGHRLSRRPLPTSDPKFGLIRPPRA